MAGDYNSILFKYEGEVAPSAIGSLKAMRDHLREVTSEYQAGRMSLQAYQTRMATVNADLVAFGGAGGGIQQTFRSFGMLDRILGSQVAGLIGYNHQWGIIAEQFGRFAFGGLVTTGILAGLAAIAIAYDKLSGGAAQAAKDFTAAADAFDSAAQGMVKSDARARIGLLKNQGNALLGEARARLKELQAPFGPFMGSTVGTQAQIDEAQRRVQTLTHDMQALTLAEKELDNQAEQTRAALMRQLNDALAPLGDPKLQANIRNAIRSIMGPSDQEVAQGEADILTGGQLAAMETWQKVHNAFREEGRKARERMKATEERAWRQFGLSLGNAFINGLVESLSHGFRDFGGMLKSLILEGIKIAAEYGLRVALAHALGPAGAVAGGAADTIMSNGGMPSAAVMPGSAGMDFSNFPAARDPLSMARDATWQTFLRQSNRVAEHGGARSLR